MATIHLTKENNLKRAWYEWVLLLLQSYLSDWYTDVILAFLDIARIFLSKVLVGKWTSFN